MAGIHAEGVGKVTAALALMQVRVVTAARRQLSDELHAIARQTRVMLSLGYHPPGTPTGSVPPSPPWRISGALSRSVGVGEPRLTFGRRGVAWRGHVGADKVYARIQERGGLAGRNHASYLPPRPYLAPAWQIVKPGTEIRFREAMRRATRPK